MKSYKKIIAITLNLTDVIAKLVLIIISINIRTHQIQ